MSSDFLRKKFHLSRMEEVRSRFYQAILDDTHSAVANASAEVRAAWQPVCDQILENAFSFHDPLGQPDRDTLRQMTRHVVNTMLTEGLCEDLPMARRELERLNVHAHAAMSEIHADPKQRELLHGKRPQVGEQRRVRGRFGKKFTPEDTAYQSFAEILMHANYNARVSKSWDQAFNYAMAPFWKTNLACQELRQLSGDLLLPPMFAVQHHLHEVLAARHTLPALHIPQDHLAKLIHKTAPDQSKTVETIQLRGAWDAAVQATLLQAAADDLCWAAHEQLNVIWNAESVGRPKQITLQQLAMMKEAMEGHTQQLIDSLLPVAAAEIISPLQQQRFSGELTRLCALANGAVQNFTRRGAGRQTGAAL